MQFSHKNCFVKTNGFDRILTSSVFKKPRCQPPGEDVGSVSYQIFKLYCQGMLFVWLVVFVSNLNWVLIQIVTWAISLLVSQRVKIQLLPIQNTIRNLAYFDSHTVFIKVCNTAHKTDCRCKKPPKFVPLKLEICLNYAFSLDLCCYNIVWTLTCFNSVCMYG